MKPTISISFLLLATILFSCNSVNNPVNSPQQATHADSSKVSADYNSIMDSIRNTLQGASFPDTIRNKKIFLFSDNVKYDTFELKISPGLIAKSTAIYTIKTSENRVIYCDSFQTACFEYYIFEPDSIPAGVPDDSKYSLQYARSLKKSQYEAYAMDKINRFFDGIFVTADLIKQIAGDNEITNKALFDKVINDTTLKVISI